MPEVQKGFLRSGMAHLGQAVWRGLLRYRRSFSFVGLVLASLFFAASVTPSLLPRPYAIQGVLSGFSMAFGYGLGVAGVWFWRFLELRDPEENIERITKRTTVVATAVIFVCFLRQMTFWQNSIRERMEMPPVETAYSYRIGLIAIVCAVVLVFQGRIFASSCKVVSRWLGRFMPRRVANTFGFLVVVFLTVMLFNDVIAKHILNAADRTFDRIDSLADEGVAAPSDALMSGSSESLVSWGTIGRRGKTFLAGGPTQEQIAKFHNVAESPESAADALLDPTVKSPIRVFVGLRSRPDAASRAKLAVDELIRAGGFDRKVLIVATPTGTGWLDPSAVDTIEYLHRGDTAIASIQYSYLPSWLTVLVDPERSRRAANALFDAVYAHWTKLPKDSRPSLYLHGLSLGAMGSETSADLYTIFDDPIQGAVWSGTPFPSQQWNEFVRDRNEGSPVWLPTFRDGSMVRFMNQSEAFGDGQRWGGMRNVYIQYPSDPMVWFSPDLAFEKPAWMIGQRGPDVSPYLKWYPIVTFLQIAFDLPMATSVPLGHGHKLFSVKLHRRVGCRDGTGRLDRKR